jgi:hypothetical protein
MYHAFPALLRLFVAFMTFWTGLFFFQTGKPWWNDQVSSCFAIELISINVLYMLLSLRWFLILKLMDTTDLIMTQELQGADEKELKTAKKTRDWLRKFVPEWKVIHNLWAKKAWQSTIRHQIIKDRTANVWGFKKKRNGKTSNTSTYAGRGYLSLSSSKKLHEKAMSSIGLGGHIEVSKLRAKRRAKLKKKTKIQIQKPLVSKKVKINRLKQLALARKVLAKKRNEKLKIRAKMILMKKRLGKDNTGRLVKVQEEEKLPRVDSVDTEKSNAKFPALDVSNVSRRPMKRRRSIRKRAQVMRQEL